MYHISFNSLAHPFDELCYALKGGLAMVQGYLAIHHFQPQGLD